MVFKACKALKDKMSKNNKMYFTGSKKKGKRKKKNKCQMLQANAYQ